MAEKPKEAKSSNTTIRVRVPATSANLGPGFDTLGIALDLYNVLTLSDQTSSLLPSPADGVSLDAHPMVKEAAAAFFAALQSSECLISGEDALKNTQNLSETSFTCSIAGDVPPARGLGSSVTVRLGVLWGLNALMGGPLSEMDLYHLCVKLEGHPDNAAPACFGGFVVADAKGSFQRFAVASRLKVVLWIPPFEVSTSAARQVLPESISFASAQKTVAAVARHVAAWASQNYEALADSRAVFCEGSPGGAHAGAFEDHLHQPYRAQLVPQMEAVLQAGRQAGALGGWLSGSGSTLACVTLRDPCEVAEAMYRAGKLQEAVTRWMEVTNTGVCLVDDGRA